MSDNTTLPGTGDVIADEDVSGVKYQKMKLADATKGSSSPIGISGAPLFTTDESLWLLRRIVKLMESQAAADPQQRMRVAIDAVTSGTGGPLTVAQATAANLQVAPIQTTAANMVVTVGAAIAAGTNQIGGITNVAGYDQRLFIDMAREAYNTGIRSKLTFS